MSSNESFPLLSGVLSTLCSVTVIAVKTMTYQKGIFVEWKKRAEDGSLSYYRHTARLAPFSNETLRAGSQQQ